MGIEDKFDFKRFVQRIYINGNVTNIYEYWTKKDLIEKWYVKHADYHTSEGQIRSPDELIQINDEYAWAWTDGTKLNGFIIVADGNENLKFTFGNEVTVSVKFKQFGKRTLIQLTQEQNVSDIEMKFENYMSCFPGWLFYLINLKSVFEFGNDLRENDPNIELLVNI